MFDLDHIRRGTAVKLRVPWQGPTLCRCSERVDIVDNRNLPQQHLADDVRRLDAVRENRRGARASGRKASGEVRIVQKHPFGPGNTIAHFNIVTGQQHYRELEPLVTEQQST